MPSKPPHPCNQSECHTLTTRRFCDKHEQEDAAKQNADRSPETAKRYNRLWRKVSRRFLRDHPYCSQCGEQSDHTHHIKAIADGGARLDPQNLAALCVGCHTQTHARKASKTVLV